jgi:hypothetical protein
MKKIEPVDDFTQDLGTDFLLMRSQGEGFEEITGAIDCHAGDFRNAFAPYLHIPCLRPQSIAVTLAAASIASIPADEYADMHFVLLLFQAIEESQNSRKSALAPDNPLSMSLGQLTPGCIDINAIVGGKLDQAGVVLAVPWFCPGMDRAFGKAHGGVGNDTAKVKRDGVAKTLAFRAGSERVVEGEQPRFRFFVFTMAQLAFESVAELAERPRRVIDPSNLGVVLLQQSFPLQPGSVDQQYLYPPSRFPSTEFKRIDQATSHVVPHY